MCGIAGILRWTDELLCEGEVERMTSAIAHRGPDGVGFLKREGVALGHRRLAIIDPTLGQQPMSNEQETSWITYNGELYNYKELREELRQKGHRFVTNSDTEVVIHAYDEWGPDCVRKFRGMFAFALADFRKRKLFLARDHFGIKPLYYRVSDDYLGFASELSALRQIDDAAPEGSLLSIDLYLRYQYIPTPHTIYRDTFKLPPATYLLVDFDGQMSGPVKYWELAFKPDTLPSDEEWEKEIEATIADSVKAHLVADVPFGIFLSGGVDSSLVAMEMSRILERPVQAFAIGFKEDGYSELEYAEQVARKLGIELHTAIVEDDSLDFLPELVAHYGEPFGDSSAIPTWYVSRLAREHVPMVLSGDGGDEGFGGYGSYAQWMKTDPLIEAKEVMHSAIHAAREYHPRRAFYWFRQSLRQYLNSGNDLAEWQKLICYVHDQPRRALWKPEYRQFVSERCELFAEADRQVRRRERLSYAQYLDYQTYLPCDILTKVDVASMYHGLEVRTPLIDLRVFDLARRLPLSQRYRMNGGAEPAGKYLLKKLLGKSFSREFVHRKKQGFAIPRDRWFLPGKSARRMLDEVLRDGGSRLHDLFEPSEIRRHIDIHEVQENSNTLWLLLVLGLWLRQNPEVSFG
jgi:asparagine synthase (glutamine-hydrolysing)